MATVYVRGNAIENASSYELFKKNSDGTYTSLATGSEINFNVSALNLPEGRYTLVVKAHADGYESSDFSNELTWTYDDGVTNWEIYTKSGTATLDVSSDGTLRVTDPVTTNGNALVLLASVAGSHSYTVNYVPSGAASVLIAFYSKGDEDYYFRCNGSSGVALQRYNHVTFSGAKVKEDANATTTFVVGDKISVRWENNTACLLINDTLVTSFDMASYVIDTGRNVAGVAFTYTSSNMSNRKMISNFTTE